MTPEQIDRLIDLLLEMGGKMATEGFAIALRRVTYLAIADLAWALIFTFLRMPNPNLAFWTDNWSTTLNIYSQVGLVTLVGVVSKNGILIVEFANKLQLRGRSKQEAIREAAQTRLRPILMTSFATIAGYFPLILVSGAGAAARNSIGLVLVGGMAVGTTFTLLVIPSIYMLIARQRKPEGISTAEQAIAACILPQSSEFKVPAGCSLTAEADCTWSLSCN